MDVPDIDHCRTADAVCRSGRRHTQFLIRCSDRAFDLKPALVLRLLGPEVPDRRKCIPFDHVCSRTGRFVSLPMTMTICGMIASSLVCGHEMEKPRSPGFRAAGVVLSGWYEVGVFPAIEGQTPLSHGSGTWIMRWSSSKGWGKSGIRVTVVVADCRSSAKTIKRSPLDRWLTSPPGIVTRISYPTSSALSTQTANVRNGGSSVHSWYRATFPG